MDGWMDSRHEVSSEGWKIRLSSEKWRPWKKEVDKGKYSGQECSMEKCRKMSVVVLTVDPDIPVISSSHL